MSETPNSHPEHETTDMDDESAPKSDDLEQEQDQEEALNPADFEFVLNDLDGDGKDSKTFAKMDDGAMLQAAASKMQDQQKRLDAMSLEVGKLRHEKLQVLADMENLRQRERREIEKATKFSIAKFAGNLLSVSDNLQRALASARSGGGELSVLIEGVELVERELMRAFEQHGIKRISPQGGEPFDVQVHQVVGTAPSAEFPANAIMHVAQDGYVIHDRLLRPADVIVSGGGGGQPPKEETPPPEETGDGHIVDKVI